MTNAVRNTQLTDFNSLQNEEYGESSNTKSIYSSFRWNGVSQISNQAIKFIQYIIPHVCWHQRILV